MRSRELPSSMLRTTTFTIFLNQWSTTTNNRPKFSRTKSRKTWTSLWISSSCPLEHRMTLLIWHLWDSLQWKMITRFSLSFTIQAENPDIGQKSKPPTRHTQFKFGAHIRKSSMIFQRMWLISERSTELMMEHRAPITSSAFHSHIHWNQTRFTTSNWSRCAVLQVFAIGNQRLMKRIPNLHEPRLLSLSRVKRPHWNSNSRRTIIQRKVISKRHSSKRSQSTSDTTEQIMVLTVMAMVTAMMRVELIFSSHRKNTDTCYSMVRQQSRWLINNTAKHLRLNNGLLTSTIRIETSKVFSEWYILHIWILWFNLSLS